MTVMKKTQSVNNHNARVGICPHEGTNAGYRKAVTVIIQKTRSSNFTSTRRKKKCLSEDAK